MSQNMNRNKGNYKVVDYDKRTGKFVLRDAGRGVSYGEKKNRFGDGKKRLADTFGRRGSGSGYGSGGGGAGFAGYGKNAARLARIGIRAGLLARKANLWMNGLDLAFQALDQWQTTRQEDMFSAGGMWGVKCDAGGPYTDYRILPGLSNSNCNTINGTCNQTGQITSGTWKRGASVSIAHSGCSNIYNYRVYSIAFGPGVGSGASRRMTFNKVMYACLPYRCPQTPVDPGPITWVPPVVVRVPTVTPQPAPSITAQPRERTQNRPAPKPGPKTDPGGKPYWPPGAQAPNLPFKGEKKWVIRDPKIADLYGKLTEIKDGLECYEKSMGIRPKGGLHERLLKAAIVTAERGITAEKFGAFVKCMIVENVQDYVIGKANQLANRITKNEYWKRPVGVGRGGFSVRMR